MKIQLSKAMRRLRVVQRFAALLIEVIGMEALFNAPAFSQSPSIFDSAGSASWNLVIPPKDEPGEPLIVSGTVYAPDGKTPVEGITVYVYHTDAEGYYRKGNNGSSNPRLHGTMRTNAEGKYEFRTIKPGPYPGGGVPAHIHYVISGKGYEKQYDEVMFEGDKYNTSKTRVQSSPSDTFSMIRPLRRDKDGVWRCVRDIKLKRK